MSSIQIINKETNYLSKRDISSISKYRECLSKFSENFENEISLKTNSPIFLDTNVLLRYYSVSFTAREQLFQFIDANKKRVIISPQVQLEFIKNREDVIQRFFEQVTTKIPKDFNTDVVNRMKGFLDLHKIVLKDYPFVEEGINKHQLELEEILQKLNETVELKRKEFTNLIVNDKLLNLLDNCILYDGLTIEETELLKKDFDFLAKNIQTDNLDSIVNKPNATFPGLGDIKAKPEDPYGDYIIFHEIMKYMISKKTDVVFLTFDNTKGDWMNKNKSPHLHYMQNMYANTGQILYIVDAERTLGELLNVNIKSLVVTETFEPLLTPITVETLKQFSLEYPHFKRINQGIFTVTIVKELNLNGYNYIEEIKRDLDKVIIALSEYLNIKKRRLNTVGHIRVGLKIFNDHYTQVNHDGTISVYDSDQLKEYHPFKVFIK